MQAPWNLAPPLRPHTSTLAAWTPLIALLLAVVLVAFLLGNVVNCGSWFVLSGTCAVHLPTVQLLPGRPFAELSGRILWAISILLFALAITSTYAVALWAIFQGFRTKLHRAAVIALGVATPAFLLKFLPVGQDFEFNLRS